MQTRATIAGVGVAQITRNQQGLDYNWVLHNPWAPSVLRVGRYLCWAFYRDQSEVLATFPGLAAIVEEAVKVYGPWGELLSGAYHSAVAPTTRLILYGHTLRNGKGKEAAAKQNAGSKSIVKWSKLGDVIDIGEWKGMKSIDGAGEVRGLELCLYQYVAYRFLRSMVR